MTARPEPYQNAPDDTLTSAEEISAQLAAGLAQLAAPELRAMTDRAYRAAALAWSELRAWKPAGAMTPDDFRTVRAMLAEDADQAEYWWRTLRHELDRRSATT